MTNPELRKEIEKVVTPYQDKLHRVAEAAMQGKIHKEPNPNNMSMIDALEALFIRQHRQLIPEIKPFKKELKEPYTFHEHSFTAGWNDAISQMLITLERLK